MPKHIDHPDEEFEFYPNASNDLYMDEVISIALAAFDQIQLQLRPYGIEIEDKGQDDDIYVPLVKTLERYSNGEYRHQN